MEANGLRCRQETTVAAAMTIDFVMATRMCLCVLSESVGSSSRRASERFRMFSQLMGQTVIYSSTVLA
jgi:hypothetical protein